MRQQRKHIMENQIVIIIYMCTSSSITYKESSNFFFNVNSLFLINKFLKIKPIFSKKIFTFIFFKLRQTSISLHLDLVPKHHCTTQQYNNIIIFFTNPYPRKLKNPTTPIHVHHQITESRINTPLIPSNIANLASRLRN